MERGGKFVLDEHLTHVDGRSICGRQAVGRSDGRGPGGCLPPPPPPRLRGVHPAGAPLVRGFLLAAVAVVGRLSK